MTSVFSWHDFAVGFAVLVGVKLYDAGKHYVRRRRALKLTRQQAAWLRNGEGQ